MRAASKKDTIIQLWQGLQASLGSSENYHMVPTNWLRETLANNQDDIKKLDTSELLCKHAKLNLMSDKYKVISQQQVGSEKSQECQSGVF